MAGTTTGIPANVTQGSQTKGGVGESMLRPDGTLKVTGEFAYSSDMWHEEMLWGQVLRSTVAHAEIVSIDTSEALALSGVYAVLTADDLPAAKNYGMEYQDTPVLAYGKVRHHGEPVALVAADHPETARRAAAKIKVEYRELPVITDEASATAPDAILVHENRGDHHAGHVPHPNIVHRQPIIRGNADEAAKKADVIVRGEYTFGMQDQAFLGPESGLAVPAEDGGVDLYVATQWLHSDLKQIAPCLGLPEEKVRMTMAGIGGAFGGREDISMQILASVLALRTSKPVKMVYNRYESFFGHVHRHPAKLYYEHGATKDGKLTHMKCKIVLDGGAYMSSTPSVVGNASSLSVGPYVVDDVEIEAIGLYTNNPPCGAMRGFGAVQACFAYEAQMDKVAAKLGMDPVAFRQKNAMEQGTIMPTGQPVDSPAPVAELLRRVKARPLPPVRQWESSEGADVRALPGGLSNTTHGEGVVRGVGYAVGIKNVGFSEGFDDYSTAKIRLEVINGEAVATVHTAAAEVGQGGVTIHAQIARTELGVQQVTIAPADTQVGSAGSTSAGRQTYMTGGAIKNSCEIVREKVLEIGRRKFGSYHPAWANAELLLEGGKVVTDGGEVLTTLVEVLEDEAVEVEEEFRHRPTEAFDLRTGQGNGHVQYAFAAHRAVVEVDTELGLVKVIELACAQDVGKAVNPLSVIGQIQGGTTQGLGVAVMEEIIVDPKTAKVRNPSFTDYLLPTILDTPTIPVDYLELADPNAPYGVRGIGEAPTLSSTPAVLAAIRNATGLELNKTPVRPEHLTGT
ncbi:MULTISPECIES: molybdopterin cofactor-binding domain-containing protein [unclassified Streptomyces]|uniref:xanthine dehydrogenase family protein molybdopterin-binding subunit n=1 Tax=unclassified Streptomyces TaxID=2593676 RepID=UPI0013680754|nr:MULTISPECIES: molybdopterin cofactor-binding domain-containing protein [unclassified Streptomyces]NEA02935.1 molybdopterin-dependent oxidoreductase [Streptomyces sp. SID10116]MYY86686.1 molybdopterin-dependent oxidoreductase [Streptomyces sp. SID335]MYZ15534.1 molybdopterin-dependent oxidoreductase [Streptomyces sp. SID337]NDZ86606.1 molybdopterin-dependent oxidoreductase [Streptomyces sp. SID10115]NEB43201.1 molybdopterin-dependent oxidoreductase [Streptomyces sp. SID339]